MTCTIVRIYRALAGLTGQRTEKRPEAVLNGKRLEAIEIKLVKKGESAPGSTKKAYQVPKIQYQTHVQSIGWQKK